MNSLLLIEDDDVDAERIERWLDRSDELDCDILRARTLAEGVALLEEHHPQIALVDLSLPDADHLDTVRAVTAASPSCAVVVQTGEADTESPTAALELGAQDYLSKGSMTKEMLERSIRYAFTRKRAEITLHSTQTELAQTDADLDDFAHVVAHDLRAPVRTARLLADRLLAQVDQPSDRSRDLAERLDGALHQVDSMILSMLDFSALRGAEPAVESVLLRPIVDNSVAALLADIESAGGALRVAVDPDLRVTTNADLLQRTVMNLLCNSAKYRRADTPLLIDITAELVGERVRLCVTDNGIGVPAEAATRVFEVLERLDHHGPQGLGFGLAICRRAMQSLHGSIWIEPTTTPGTTVVIDIPT